MREELKETRQQVRSLAENQLRLEFDFRLMKEREAWQQKSQTLAAENQELREQLRLLPAASSEDKKN